MFQFDGGTFAQTLARDGEEILLLEGNITHAVDFVTARVIEEIGGVDTTEDALAWMSQMSVTAGDPVFEDWIELLACRYNGCCGCSSQEGKYRDATLAALTEFEDGFWTPASEPDPEDPTDPTDPADPTDPGGDPDDPPYDPDGSGPNDLDGGCRTAPGAGAPWLLLVALLVAVRRRVI
jgi:hypothetical protein